MKKSFFFLVALLILYPNFVQSQTDKSFGIFLPRISHNDLRIIQLEMRPDPVREGQLISFQITISNQSYHSVKVSLFIKDGERTVSSIHDVYLYPGYNQIIFPESNYRFTRDENCFTVEVDIERTKRVVDAVRKFCARRSYYGWTLSPQLVGPTFVEELEMFPDPAHPGQEIRFRVRLRNEGHSLRGDIRINDRDQIVVELRDVFIPSGYSEYYFPYTRYFFQRSDHCFTVFVNLQKTPYKIDSIREFCARPLGWTLRP